ncbi:MAG: Mitochondrial import receptor subunit TOM70 [Thelocarpon superellum]|nr:MAG: Mitochondrial import receptor subunit TOM70 [Thelocarpon superellum]
MAANATPVVPAPGVAVDASVMPNASAAPVWDRLSHWMSEHKAIVYSVGAVAVVTTGAGLVYYLSRDPSQAQLDRDSPSSTSEERKKKKKDRKKVKKQAEESTEEVTPKVELDQGSPTTSASVEAEPELPDISEETVESFSAEERNDYATKSKVKGNEAFNAKDFARAMDLYSKAILCKPDPIFYSNRAACHNALGQWDDVVADATKALALNSEYVKALNRRGAAYEQLEQYSDALLDFTASCIIDGFRHEHSAQSVERLLKKVAEAKGKAILARKERRLPSPTFVTNYLQSFRTRPRPAGLEEHADLREDTGLGQLKIGLNAVDQRTGDGYDRAAEAFDKAVTQNELGEHAALAYNMRGTFRYLSGEHTDALSDLSKSIELQPSLTQSYIKRASMHLEMGDREAAANDFQQATEQNKDDPDIYYHRAQLHFILGEFADAATDYNKSIDLDDAFIFSHIQLGVTQYKMGSIPSSMATFKRCIKRFSKVPDVYNYYGELLLDQQKYEEAIAKFDVAVEMEKQTKPLGMNVLPLINKALALFQWKQDFQEAEKLCQKALIIDPECDIAVATMAQLLLQQGKVTDALTYFERAAELSRTEGEVVNALSYAEATRTQLEVQEKYPQLASRLQGMGPGLGGPPVR